MKTIITVCLYFLLSPASMAIGIGDQAPSCKLTALSDEKPVELSKPGKVVYIDFWASWCAPCAQSFAFMNEMTDQLKAKDFELVAINLDENARDAKSFLQGHPAKFTVAVSSDSQCQSTFNVEAMPASFLIDRQGRVRHIQLGFFANETAELRNKVEKLLAE